MTDTAKEYAAALFALARESGSEQTVYDALRLVGEQLASQPEYVAFLSCPGIPREERTAALETAFTDAVPADVLSFLCLLCEHGKITAFADCLTQYELLFFAFSQTSCATVTSAVELTEDEKSRLVAALEARSGKTVVPQYRIDEQLLGGIRVEMDGTVLDSSLRHRLHQLRDTIVSQKE